MSLAIFAAELYGFVVLLQHYSVATRSLDRTTAPPDVNFCPSVDIFVASYNEGADIVTRTLVGCQAIDYPHKQVYLLDDGRRPEMAALCKTLGVNYITRDDNKGAKAGNLNHALARTTGEFIVTFDADHVPVSSFLTETLGHFREPGVAQLQTPQHFFNPISFRIGCAVRRTSPTSRTCSSISCSRGVTSTTRASTAGLVQSCGDRRSKRSAAFR